MLNKNNIFIQKINKAYVSEDCVQVMIPYEGSMVVKCMDDRTDLYRCEEDCYSSYINKYITDERRENFPYSNIPIHTETRLLKKMTVVNQIFDFDKLYAVFTKKGNVVSVTYCKVVRDGDSALFISGSSKTKEFCMSVDELKQFRLKGTPEPNIRNGNFSREEIKRQRKLVRNRQNFE